MDREGSLSCHSSWDTTPLMSSIVLKYWPNYASEIEEYCFRPICHSVIPKFCNYMWTLSLLITFEQWVQKLWFFTWVSVNLSLLIHTFWKVNNNLRAYFVIVLWHYIIYFEVFRHISPRSLLLNIVQCTHEHFTKVDIIDILQYLQECDL